MRHKNPSIRRHRRRWSINLLCTRCCSWLVLECAGAGDKAHTRCTNARQLKLVGFSMRAVVTTFAMIASANRSRKILRSVLRNVRRQRAANAANRECTAYTRRHTHTQKHTHCAYSHLSLAARQHVGDISGGRECVSACRTRVCTRNVERIKIPRVSTACHRPTTDDDDDQRRLLLVLRCCSV